MAKFGSLKMVCALLAFCVLTAIISPAQAILHSFGESPTDGLYPEAGLVQGTDGNFYGTTVLGGAHDYGMIFIMTPAGSLTVLYSFCTLGQCDDGDFPDAPLVQGTDGNFYGTTPEGGLAGSVYKITPAGMFTTLYMFGSLPHWADGGEPDGGLVQGTDGNFYGTTIYGGGNGSTCTGEPGCGTVFKITPAGGLTTLYSFCSQLNCTDGSIPQAGLVQATDGNFYGTTSGGGAHGNLGTVFKIDQQGWTILHSFNYGDGCAPFAGLVQGSDGNFYGTTSQCGYYSNGTVFKITPAGSLAVLYTFCPQYPNCTDGSYPKAGLVQGTDGNFYGTTSGGGANGYGTVFKITPAGALTTLYSFCSQQNCTDGSYPDAGLVQASDGHFYGTTDQGGAYGYGTVFRLSPLVYLSPTNLNFGIQGLNNPNTPQAVTLTNGGGASLLITTIGITGADSGDFFIESNNCPMDPGTLPPGGHCSITVVFAPTSSGMLNANVTINDDAPDSPQMVPLIGIGVGGKVRPR